MYDLESNLLSKVNASPEDILHAVEKIKPDHELHGVITPAVVMQKELGINALWIVAHAATETGWGKSLIAKTRNNFFGFNAVDSNPSNAMRYNLPSDSVIFYAGFLKEHYLTKGGKFYNGATPHGVMMSYASAGDKAAKTIVNIMNMLEKNIGAPAPDGFPTKQPTKKPEKPQESEKGDPPAQQKTEEPEEKQNDDATETPPESPAPEPATGTDAKKN